MEGKGLNRKAHLQFIENFGESFQWLFCLLKVINKTM